MRALLLATLFVASQIRQIPNPAIGEFKVSGRVTNVDPTHPQTPAPQRVLLSMRSPGFGLASGTIRPDGTFEVPNVAAGVYEIQPDRGFAFADNRIEVPGKDVSGVEVRVTATVNIPVRIRMADGTAWPGFPAGSFRLVARFRGTMLSGTAAPDGTGSILLPQGEDYFFVVPPPGYFVNTLQATNVDLLRNPIVTDTNAPPTVIDATIARTPPTPAPTVRVSGRITSSHPDMEIALVATTINAGDVLKTTVRPDGRFEFGEVGPGLYRIDAPPAQGLIEGIIAVGKDVTGLEVPVPAGVLVSGRLMEVDDENGRAVASFPEKLTIQFVGNGSTKSREFPYNKPFVEGLARGTYLVSVENLPAGYSVRVLASGTTNLLQDPLRIEGDSSPAAIRIVLQFKP